MKSSIYFFVIKESKLLKVNKNIKNFSLGIEYSFTN